MTCVNEDKYIMVKSENRKYIIKEKQQQLHQHSLEDKELQSIANINKTNCDPMVHRKLEICNDVERNPGPNQDSTPVKKDSKGGKKDSTPINDNPRVSKIGKF